MKTTKSLHKYGLFIIGLMFAVSGYAQTFLTNDLIAFYPFNGNANDASGNGHNASVQGTYQYLSDGTLHLIGDGQLFYSGGGYVALPNYGNLNSGFTISIWVANETDHGSGIYSEYYVYFDNNNQSVVWMGQHDFLAQDNDAYADLPFTIANFTPWKQLVLVYSPGNCAAYLNGVMIGSTNVTITPFPMVNSAIGRHWWAGGANSSARMTMDVKDFRIYNRALSTNEVAQLYAIESAPSFQVKKAVYLTDNSLYVGSNYQVQVSSDLTNWTNSGSPFTATSSSWSSTNFWPVENWNQLFFRLQAAP
jgi:Concanavalin A-like lectin/glucanases superfamily